jgi:hypothetical protein
MDDGGVFIGRPPITVRQPLLWSGGAPNVKQTRIRITATVNRPGYHGFLPSASAAVSPPRRVMTETYWTSPQDVITHTPSVAHKG